MARTTKPKATARTTPAKSRSSKSTAKATEPETAVTSEPSEEAVLAQDTTAGDSAAGDAVAPEVDEPPAADAPSMPAWGESDSDADVTGTEPRDATLAASDLAWSEDPPRVDLDAPGTPVESPPRDSSPEPPPADPVVAPAMPPQQVTVQKVGFAPLAAGGAVAALAGLAVGWVLFGQAEAPDLSALDAQGARLEEFGARLDALPAAPDPAELRAAVQTDLDTIGGEIAILREDLAALGETQAGIDARLDAVERAPNEDGTLADEALAAFDGDFEDLRSRIAALADRIDSATAETQAALDAREAELAAAEEAARAEAATASLRSALVELRAALQGGEPYPETLALLQDGGEVPAPLPELAESGAPTLAELQAAFPDAAREALGSARASGADGEDGGGLGGILRSTFNVRSTAPREGTTVDAILSRAEAALAEGDLAAALAEVDSLPAGAAAPLADWSATARTRLDALAAEAQLSQFLNQGD